MKYDSHILPPNMKHPCVSAYFTTKHRGNETASFDMFRPSSYTLYMPVQKHTDTVIEITPTTPMHKTADAVITKMRGILIGVVTADCVPLLLFDPVGMTVGAVHAGWRGTAAGILGKTISKMTEQFGTDPDDLTLAVGPSIRGCCYAVGADVLEAVEKAGGGCHKHDIHSVSESGIMLNLAEANRAQALSAGLKAENIWISGECTFCSGDRFHSYRRSGALAGRQGGFIAILNEKTGDTMP
ncbi:MAG: peptidoglycan editing factor PgeF [Nitrospirae bacterium]|nr:peptidoglycan editing factor PgeF [Nitrospirota bacterium]